MCARFGIKLLCRGIDTNQLNQIVGNFLPNEAKYTSSFKLYLPTF